MTCNKSFPGSITLNKGGTLNLAQFYASSSCIIEGDLTITDGPLLASSSAVTLTLYGNYSNTDTDEAVGDASTTLIFASSGILYPLAHPPSSRSGYHR